MISFATSAGFGEKNQATFQSIFLNFFSDWFRDGPTFEVCSSSNSEPPPGSGDSDLGVGLVVVGIASKFVSLRKESFP